MIYLLRRHKSSIIGFYVFLLFVQFILKDHFFPISIIFYAFPLFILVVYSFILLLIYKNRKLLFINFIIITTVFVIKNFKLEKDIDSISNIEILYWNIAKNKEDAFPILIDKVIANKPNIIALVEAEKIDSSDIHFLSKKLKEYKFSVLKGNMILGLKTEKMDSKFVNLDDNSKFNKISTVINNKNFNFLIVDVTANPFKSREKSLNSIYKYSIDNKCDLLIGDFNTPYNSVHFENYKNEYSNADRIVGHGFISSWAFGIPLMQIDHIWSDKKLKIIDCSKEYYTPFDHPIFKVSYN